MPRFGSKESPSLRKMELNGGRNTMGRSKFSMGNIIGDPFSLATIGIAICGWLIAFISSVLAAIDNEYPNFAWWTLGFMLAAIVGIFVAVATNTTQTYHVAIVGFMSAGLVFTTSSVNSLIYFPEASKEAAAAGFILLSMVAIVWIFYFGSQPQAAHRQTIDSFALHKDHSPSRRGSRHRAHSYGPETRHSTGGGPHVVNSTALVGFENSSPVAGGYPSGTGQRGTTGGGLDAFGAPTSNTQSPVPHPGGYVASPRTQQQLQQENAARGVTAPTAEYPYRAKAIYSYEANPDDANEISFTKHEILEVSDVSGRWWQAKKENGETGIAPSNYLILL